MREFVFQLKTKVLTINGIEVPCVKTKVTHGTNGETRFSIEDAYSIDPAYKSLNRKYQQLHLELIRECTLTNVSINQLYQMLLTTDRTKRVRLAQLGFYMIQVNKIVALLQMHDACQEVRGGFKKTEAFVDFLMGRKEAREGEVDERTLKTTSLSQRKEEEARAERKYIVPSNERLEGMSLMELQLEHTEAVEKGARKTIIKRLAGLMSAKKKAAHNKSDMELMKEVIHEEKQISKAEKENNKPRKTWKDKQGAEYIE